MRFLILGALIIAYGPEILKFGAAVLRDHRGAAIAIVAAIVFLIFLFVRFRHSHTHQPAETESTVV